MGESYHFHNHQDLHHQQQPIGSSRLGLRTSAGGRAGVSGGEIVEVQGGHIVRSTGRKDRHSKVCTAKGPRDRRVRLSAHTAIQFYDVQDRLGYDRPSKAVDWLIKKAKTAIDELAELPAWKPTNTHSAPMAEFPDQENANHQQLSHFEQHPDENIVDTQMGVSQNSSFLPPSLDSDAIADTIKSFFPMGASSNLPNNSTATNTSSSSGMQFHHQNSFPQPDLLSRTSSRNRSRNQDLCLSLQSFQDPTILQTHQSEQANNHGIFFDGSGWPDNNANPPGGFQRMVAWGGNGGTGGGGDGFIFGSPPVAPFLQPLTSNHQLFHNNSQRGPLQSSNTPSLFRGWIDLPPPQPFTGGGGIDQQPTIAFHHPSSMAGYASGGFSGFRIPARIQGEDEEHDGISDKPSSASSDSRH